MLELVLCGTGINCEYEATWIIKINVRHHFLFIVRDLSLDINWKLVDLGAGPVLEETAPDGTGEQII